MANDNLGVFDTPPTPGETRLVLALACLALVAFVTLVLASQVHVGEIAAFIPLIDSVVAFGELIIAALLYGQVAVFRSRALTVLASTFVFAAFLLVAHGLTFPGAFAPDGLLGPRISSTAWIMVIRRMGFPLGLILYAVLKEPEAVTRDPIRRPPFVLAWVSGAMALAGAGTVLAIAGNDLLPPLFVNRSEVVYSNLLVVNLSNIALILVAMAVLFFRRRSVLDIWLELSLAGWLMQSMLNLPLHARFTVGWYSLFLVILVSHLCLLLALIAKSNRLYARLALSTAARERERQASITSTHAVAAAISHEVGQPVAAMTVGAQASLRWLNRPQPNVDNAIQSLHDTIEAGRRTLEVLGSVRDMVRNEPAQLSEFSLNELVRETSSLLAGEFAEHRISVQLALDETLPPIRANRVQIQRVLINLLTNAIEAFDAASRTRRISICSKSADPDNVLLEISDSGSGISPELMAEVFEPFYTTKTTGTGLGLALSRSILEENRGRLWASNGPSRGAVFHLQLPSSGLVAPS